MLFWLAKPGDKRPERGPYLATISSGEGVMPCTRDVGRILIILLYTLFRWYLLGEYNTFRD